MFIQSQRKGSRDYGAGRAKKGGSGTMRKEGMKRSITANPDPTYREAAEQKKRGLKAVRTILAIKTMAKNHDFEIIGHIILRDRNSGREYKEGGIR